MNIEFSEWAKIPRWNRDITVTEKIDGTNGGIGIKKVDEVAMRDWCPLPGAPYTTVKFGQVETELDGLVSQRYVVYAQSRTRIITPATDNYGFAKWVWSNATELAGILGDGLHFGEWWGSGIRRAYGLQRGDRRFSLFNTSRWEKLSDVAGDIPIPVGLGVVPILYEGPVNGMSLIFPWNKALAYLRENGSVVSPGFMNPEGVVIYHHAANMCFKITLENDASPKALFEQEFGTDPDEVIAEYNRSME